MLRRAIVGRPGLVLVLTVIAAVAAVQPVYGEDLARQVEQHLAAGEFTTALDLASRAAPADRDALLQRVAAAQSRAGARRAAVSTLARIDDDSIRADAVDHILAQQFGTGVPVGTVGSGGSPFGGRGGNSTADFDAIIELIQSTIAPDSWDEVGGPGSIADFEGGVVVDAGGLMRRIALEPAGEELRRLWRVSSRSNRDNRLAAASPLRKVSLSRLEKAIELRMATGRKPDAAMQCLAGLNKIQYVMVYPETGDLVIAGSASDWQQDQEGRLVSVDNGRPVLRLEDFVVVLRALAAAPDGRFGCSITPTKSGLARTKAFVAESSKNPLPPGRAARERWLDQLREALGRQDIEIYGVDPSTRVAQVLVEADYRMKLVGMGIEKGTIGVSSYLDLIQLKKGAAPPPMDVLRWWFTLNYDAIRATQDRDAFEVVGQGVQVLSENEMLTKMGERVHTGKSDELNRQFAASFTREFPRLAAKYPVYAELQNVFDLALVAALVRAEDLPEHVGWQMRYFLDPNRFPTAVGPAPQQVDSVINHRLVNGNQIVAGVSGGVRVDPGRYVTRSAIKVAPTGEMVSARRQSNPKEIDADRWWWD